ncbi:hypothetical protein PENSTE_c020G03985 [Penicillium steckii]|uniref:HMA domain-containing protein n=1 Tax=Penicillium steckii TaxID=303698 RepID=A0A1V6SUH4_9EURO|nr:hypothetical protein PENSTE_c020G03985 [Penicillium steckii]
MECQDPTTSSSTCKPGVDFAAIPDEKTRSSNGCKNSCCDTSRQTVPAQEESEELIKDDPRSLSSPDNCHVIIDNDLDGPDCCRGKQSPCCDMSCIDRLAMRECTMSATGALEKTSEPNNCSGHSDGKACNQHSLSALDRYGATLQTLGCICRALIALGQKTCCELDERRSLNSKKCSKESSAESLLRSSLDSCGRSNSIYEGKLPRSRKSSSKSISLSGEPSGRCQIDLGRSKPKPIREPCDKGDLSKSCCSKDKIAKSPARKNDPCCSESDVKDEPPKTSCSAFPRPISRSVEINETRTACVGSCCSKNVSVVQPPSISCFGSSCKDRNDVTSMDSPVAESKSCCKPLRQHISKNGSETLRSEDEQTSGCKSSSPGTCCSSLTAKPSSRIDKSSVPNAADIEKLGSGKEHVVLSISGMTCTGCETKLNRTLGTVSAVSDLKTSLVLSRAEFNIDLSLGSVGDVMKHLERTTEFKCQRIQSQGYSIDLIVPSSASDFANRTWPSGVIEITPMDEHSVRVVFDPNTVGPRDLVEKIWGPPVKLAPVGGDPSLEAGSKHVRHVGYMTLLSASLTIPVLVLAWASLPKREIEYASTSLALATIVQAAVAGPFYPKALKALIFSKVIEMDLLIVLSTSAAYIFSVVSFGYLIANRPLSTGQFFETSTLLVTLIMVGRWVAALARQRAVESISIRSLQTSTAILVDENSGTEREIDTRLLQYGDSFKVLPESKVPTDGTVINGSSEVDESMLTGESRPVEKYPGSIVIPGSINGSGVMTVRLNRLPCDNTIMAIATMVDEAKLSKPKLQDLADRVAAYFVPVVVLLTIITFVIWIAIGMAIRGESGAESAIQAITYAITVLIVSCPCAIGLAVPMVIVISSGVAAEKGIIFKSADAIELAYKTKHVVFDKTGTLTQGKLSIVESECTKPNQLPLLLGLIENSRHPVSVAVATHLKDAGIQSWSVPESKSLTGKGVEANLDDKKLRAGNSRWLNLSNHELVQPLLTRGLTVFCFTNGNDLIAVYGLEDELRSDAADTIETLQKNGVLTHIVSGDDDGAVKTVAFKLGIPVENIRSRSSPADKKDYVQNLLSIGRAGKESVVIFCGDGTNDAVALAQATVGVHMNEGTDIAQSAADVVLMRPSLASILVMMNASRKAVNRIKFNFAWSFIYNVFAVLLAAGAFVNARIPPEYAGLGELVSVLPVIAAAVLLRWSNI